MALVKRVYDINLNYLGVRSQESGVRSQKLGVRRKERRRKNSRGRKFFVCALIRTRHHTSNDQRRKNYDRSCI
ncbi:MAG: hypothetical protein F6K18_25800 [Okeania sp. SIO2C2]|uniref:hypothetical protein n=1 Tax=Okeania sp. SIO2C2 TaxID=2607787 RepID=UPI0013B778C3|nr:hypothetical protein [Okeania sp. SIO2C2]NEP89960.1 hypothetical protein [Okeania sp. SIO2C2]